MSASSIPLVHSTAALMTATFLIFCLGVQFGQRSGVAYTSIPIRWTNLKFKTQMPLAQLTPATRRRPSFSLLASAPDDLPSEVDDQMLFNNLIDAPDADFRARMDRIEASQKSQYVAVKDMTKQLQELNKAAEETNMKLYQFILAHSRRKNASETEEVQGEDGGDGLHGAG
eukprot:EG_transcript_28775